MEKIVVIDHFFEEKDIQEIVKKIEKNWDSNVINNDYLNRCLSVAYYIIDLTTDPFFSYHLKRIIDVKLKQTYKTIRINALCQNIYQNCGFHTDHFAMNKLLYENGQDKDSKHITFCYYLHSAEDEGHLYFRTDDKCIACFETKKNRGILFPGYLLHSPMGYTTNMNLRICITWKMEMI